LGKIPGRGDVDDWPHLFVRDVGTGTIETLLLQYRNALLDRLSMLAIVAGLPVGGHLLADLIDPFALFIAALSHLGLSFGLGPRRQLTRPLPAGQLTRPSPGSFGTMTITVRELAWVLTSCQLGHTLHTVSLAA
jgi:hypothetical protein